jgi:lysophospholipase L1-like esterase
VSLLHAEPAPDLRPVRVLAVAAGLAPAAAVSIDALRQMTASAGAPPITFLALLLALVWAGAFARRGWRELWIDLVRVLLGRVGCVALGLVALGAALVAASDHGGALLRGLAASFALLCAAAVVLLRRRDPARLRRLAALACVQLVLLVVLDLAVRVWVLPMRSHDNLFVTHDPVLGWKLQPGLASARKHELYASYETINSLGFRTPDRPFAKPPGTQRIVILGDSQTESYTVDDEEAYPRLLEQELARTRPTEVISLGVGGYSTDQELLSYLEYGRRFEPDLVLLQFSFNDVEFNDLPRYRRGLKPYFTRYGDVLVLQGVPVPNLRNSGLLSPALLSTSAIAVQLEHGLRKLAIERDVRRVADLEEGWTLTELLIRDLRDVVAADGADFCVFNATPDAREPDERLQAILARLDVPYVETLHVYGGDFAGLRYGGHWNEEGHRRIAAELTRALSSRLASR